MIGLVAFALWPKVYVTTLDGITLREPIETAEKTFVKPCQRSRRVVSGIDIGGEWLTCYDKHGVEVDLLSFSDSVWTIIVRPGFSDSPRVIDPFGVHLGDSISNIEQIRGRPSQPFGDSGIGYFDSPSLVSWYELKRGVVSGIRLAVYPHPIDLRRVINRSRQTSSP
jgi:hypothetical protein